MSDLAAICAAIDADLTPPVNPCLQVLWYLSSSYEHVVGSRHAVFRNDRYVHLPPSLVDALGDLAKPLLARRWDIPVEVQAALHSICRVREASANTHTRPEDVRVFLDWVGIAVLEATLDA